MNMNKKPQAHKNVLPTDYRLHWYTLEKVLGRGGFGITYLARDDNLNTRVAIKEFLPSNLAIRDDDLRIVALSDDQQQVYQWGLTRFIEEARTLAKFRHPNIVLVHSVFEENNTAYIVMEYHEGGTLDQAFRHGRFENEQDLKRLLLALMDGVEEVHNAGFVHRDIKPTNIYMKDDTLPVLLDFGSARQALGMETQTLTTLVSPGYAPFEQYNATRTNDLQGPWTDIYALACCIYRAIAGVPYEDALVIARKRLGGEAVDESPAATAGRDRYSREFLEAIDAGMAFAHQQRPQTIAQWREMLLNNSAAATVIAPVNSDDIATVMAPTDPSEAALPSVTGQSPASGQQSTTANQPSTGQVNPAPPSGAEQVDLATLAETAADPASHRSKNTQLLPMMLLLVLALGGGIFWFAKDRVGAGDALTTASPMTDESSVTNTLTDTSQADTTTPPADTEMQNKSGEIADSESDTVIASTSAGGDVDGDVEQALTDLIGELGCSQMQVSVADNEVLLQGYSDDSSVTRLKATLGANYPQLSLVTDQLDMIPSQACAALPALSTLWADTDTTNIAVNTPSDDNSFVEGDRLVVEVSSDLFESNHVYIDYFAIDGSVTHLLNGNSEEVNSVARNTAIVLGEEGGIERWDVAAPYGEELISVIVSDQPLFEQDPQPEYQSSDSYAQTLEQVLASAREKGVTVSASKLLIHTTGLN